MKLKNKKTGEIGLLSATDNAPTMFVDSREYKTYNSLAELCEEWEDYEEPKSFYAISLYPVKVIRLNTEIYKKDYSQIGNVFETEEEAELAVKKLKAWKRLKDKGLKFEAYKPYGAGITFTIAHMDELAEDNKKDLELLFGGEE